MHSANGIFWQETHLQKALTAQQFYGTAEARAIPIPEVQSVDERYCKLYTPDFKLPKQYIHIQGGHKIRVWNQWPWMWTIAVGKACQSAFAFVTMSGTQFNDCTVWVISAWFTAI